MQLTLYVDQDTRNRSGSLPRNMSASMIVRFILKAATANDKEFARMIREDDELKRVREYLRPRLLALLGEK